MMWPMTGNELLQVLEEDLQIVSEMGTSREHNIVFFSMIPTILINKTYTMVNGCNIQVTPDTERPDCLIIQAYAPVPYLIDIAEQLAWLGEALSASDQPRTICRHYASCSLGSLGKSADDYTTFSITYSTEVYDSNDNARCWKNLFSNPSNERNRNLVLDEESNYRVEDEIRNIFERLQELAKAHDKNSEDWATRLTDRARLEGYSFRNIVDDVSLLSPKMVYLEESSGDWIKLVHDTKAVVLMARGLGELISSRRTICPNWRTVPIGKDYLVAKIGLLYDIAASEGREEDFPFWLTHNTRWHRIEPSLSPVMGRANEAPMSAVPERKRFGHVSSSLVLHLPVLVGSILKVLSLRP